MDWIEFWEEEVLPRLNVEAVYEGVPWRSRQGRYWRGPCPLHGGDDPNFSVDTQSLHWRCFSRCGGGSVFAYLNGGSEPRGAQWMETLERLAQHAGVPLPRPQLAPEELKRLEERTRRAHLLEHFARLAQSTLLSPAGETAQAYLQSRGFAPETWPRLPLGYYPAQAAAELHDAGFTAQEIEASGLLRDARWENRLLIFWRDARARLGTIAARDLSGQAAPKDKYLYLSRQHGFARAKAELIAFGLDTALPHIRRGQPLLLVEGLLDALALHSRGLENVAAIGGGGTEYSPARLGALARLGVRHLIVLLDNDPGDGRWPGLEGTRHIARLAITLPALAGNGPAGNGPADNAGNGAIVHIGDNGDNSNNSRNADNGTNTDNVAKGNVSPDYVVVEIVHPRLLGRHKDPDAYVRARGLDEFAELLEQRHSAAVFLANEALETVSPQSSEATRRAAAETVIALDAQLGGPLAPLDREELRRLAAQQTGFTAEALGAIADDLARAERQQRLRRELERTLRNGAGRVGQDDPSLLLNDLNQDLAQLRATLRREPPPFSVARLDEESRRQPPGKSSGWSALDRLGVQFGAGEFALVGARTGHGKTSFLVALAWNWIKAHTDETLLFYTLEEPELRLYHRLLALLAAQVCGSETPWSVPEIRDYLRDPSVRGEQYGWPSRAWLEDARDTLRTVEERIQIVFEPNWSIDDMDAHARATAARRPVGGIMVDYLQRVPPAPGRFDRRDQEVSALGRRFKGLAVDLGVPVVAGAQINREAIPEGYSKTMNAARSYGEVLKSIRAARPELHHLREGGSEQEADLALGLLNYAADYRGDAAAPPVTHLEIGTLKNRNGEPGKWAALAFVGRAGLVRDALPGEGI